MNTINRPHSIGHFRIAEKLGEGGMGTVYVGVDDTLDRRVALKVIRREHRLDPVHKARLLREARILSQLDHVGVCQLYDFIEGEKDDCLVLELVEGRSLREAIADGIDRAQGLNIAAQMLTVLAAVHGKGIIHRDLKPDNVMLLPNGSIKILDFGIAREDSSKPQVSPDSRGEEKGEEAQQGDSDATKDHDSLTSVGAVVGTVGYMSPEQAQGEPATAASDLYSLGLILQELLTGQCPIRKDLPPDVRLRQAMWGESEPVTGLPPELTGLVERMKELEPTARPTAVDAAAILARARDRPRLRRRRIAVAVIIVLLTLSNAGMTVQYLRAERESYRASEEATTAQLVVDTLVGLFKTADPWLGGEEEKQSVRDIVDRGVVHVERLSDRPLLQARLRSVLGSVYYRLGLFDEAIVQLELAADTRTALLGEDHPQVADCLGILAEVQSEARNWRSCHELAERVLQIRTRSDAEPIKIARAKLRLAICSAQLGHSREALAMLHDQLPVFEDAGEGEETLFNAMGTQAVLLRINGRFDEAEALYRDLIKRQQRFYGPKDLPVARTLNNLAYLLRKREKYDEAELLYRQTLEILGEHLAPHHHLYIRTQGNLAAVLTLRGWSAEGEQAVRRVVELQRQAHPEGHTELAYTLTFGLGFFLLENGRYADARPVLEEGVVQYEANRGVDHLDTVLARAALGTNLIALGQHSAGESLVIAALEHLESLETFPGERRARVEQLARCMETLGRTDLANSIQSSTAASFP